MAKENLTSREKYIVEKLKLDLPTTKIISEIGRVTGTHKYDIWIAREVKKNEKLLDRLEQQNLYYVIDWAKNSKPDIMKLDFEEAFKESTEWHKKFSEENRVKQEKKEKEEVLKKQNSNNERIIYECEDNEFFFLLLKAEDLEREGNLMKNCVGTYKSKVNRGQSLIISLRDRNNQPHVTIELDVKSGSLVQIRGKANQEPAKKYLKLITEFSLHATGYSKDVDEELLELMKSKFD